MPGNLIIGTSENLKMTDHQTQAATSLLAANFGLGIWLIPQHGTYGMAIAMSAGICVWNGLMMYEVRRRLGFDPSFVCAICRIGEWRMGAS